MHLSFLKKLVQKNPEIDMIIRGEGEKTILELIEAIKQTSNLSTVLGLTYRTNSGCKK